MLVLWTNLLVHILPLKSTLLVEPNGVLTNSGFTIHCSGRKPPTIPKTYFFMDRDERTEYQLTLCPILDRTSSVGRTPTE